MNQPRFRLAVAPLRRGAERMPARSRPSVEQVVAQLRPEEPLHCLRPATLRANARAFVDAFPGETLYAVKCNPDPRVLALLWQGGVRAFDCASPAEVALVRQLLPESAIHYMHPVKARGAIAEAWSRHGVRDFAFDSEAELEKILAATAGGSDLGLILRLALPKGEAALDLSGKFGAEPALAAHLLRLARSRADRLGIAFHVGSQCTEPAAWARAIRLAGEVIARAGAKVDILDVGGGFPVPYPGSAVPDLARFMDAISGEAAALRTSLGTLAPARLWAEPGRVLVAAGISVIVQVQARRGGMLHVNDGIYGSLSDAGALNWRFPVRLLRASEAAPQDFGFFGPTCDSLDRMNGPFRLPGDVAEGDWIEIGQLGAYGATLRTAFNGFDRARFVEVSDPPLLA
ncbi:MAG: type III PLP-dependent enzyme [Alphaproteobacteria bacterium]|nr:type III PLP-dependent enzyme [Alphaproteobacteria bacterium]